MKKSSKVLALALSLAMAASLATGCSKTPSSAPAGGSTASPSSAAPADPGLDTSKEVNLVMYLIGAPPADNEKVFTEINKIMKEKINATIEPKYFDWGEWEQKYPLVFANGEDFDMIYSADWAFYTSQASKQAYYEITKDALEKYAPMTAKNMYPEAWDQSLVGGKSFMLPMNYKELSGQVITVRGDLMKKHKIDKIETLADLEKYLDAVAQNDKELIPIDVGSDYDAAFMYDLIFKPLTIGKYEGAGPWQSLPSIESNDPDLKVTCIIERPEYLEAAKKLKEYRDKGYWSKSAVVNQTNNIDSFKSGKSSAAICNLNTAKTLYSEVAQAHPEWEIQVVDAQFNNSPATLSGFWANGMSIFSKSKNPERSLMALDLLRNDPQINSLFCFGIEGVHYETVSDKFIKLTDKNADYPYDGNCNWGVRDDSTWKFIEGGMPNMQEIITKWQENARTSPYAFFTFDDSAVKNEIAGITDAFSTDFKLINLGFVDDPATAIADLSKKLKAAGVDKVYDAIHTQLTEYVANKK